MTDDYYTLYHILLVVFLATWAGFMTYLNWRESRHNVLNTLFPDLALWLSSVLIESMSSATKRLRINGKVWELTITRITDDD